MEDMTSNAFSELEACYGQLISWCDLLEAIADFLPCHVDERLCETITVGLVPLLATSQQLEERLVCPGLGLIMNDEEFREADERRRASRLLDYDAAQEVVETLLSLREGRCALSWDAVGYQLRSFFGSMRRHIRSEREIVGLIKKAMATGGGSPVTRTVETEAA
ncbi:hypothetical protein ATY81_27425 [Rhizobium sp. R72]|uniref:hypothetical protein n=1 Tax=unclassified Rhizobium TaxID=2613769 RepID=UPI000B52FA1C|nr:MULTISPECIES: hypothetical protein [unclassified Rhizobium]OWV97086.1 hypothetical protein ATY81_27425 [Rhizobium sp. R72]OWV97109.1 hypothetical protein ATY80_27425 [Rhizobium sp. R711]